MRSIYRSSFTVAAEQIVASCASRHPNRALAALLQSPSRPAPHFVDVAADAGLNVPIVCGKPEQKDFLLEMTGCGVAFYDYDHDGWLDIFFVNGSAFDFEDSTPRPSNRLFHNNRDGTFTDITAKAGLIRSGWGQGCCVGDYDNDGWLDIVKTNFSDDTSSLYRNIGDNLFEDATYKSGIGANMRFLGWGAGFVDVNNDGWQDIFLANGHIYPEIHQWFPRLKYKERKILYKNLANGRFADISLRAGPALLVGKSSRGCAFGDFDNDGDVDVEVSNINDLPTLLRNDGTSGRHWVKVKCIGTVSNRSAIGARVRVVVGAHFQIDEVRSGSSYISQNDLRLHFGLGPTRTIDQLEIRWPSGGIESFENIPADRIYYVEEGAGKVKTFEPERHPRSKNPPSP